MSADYVFKRYFFYLKNYFLVSKYYSKTNKNMLFTHHKYNDYLELFKLDSLLFRYRLIQMSDYKMYYSILDPRGL